MPSFFSRLFFPFAARRFLRLASKRARLGIDLSFYLTEEPLRRDASRFGGKPFLPDGFKWPYYEFETTAFDDAKVRKMRRPLTFLLQLNLAELASSDVDGRLPRAGFLYFFCEALSDDWGYSSTDKGRWRVYYYDVAPDSLRETSPPLEIYEFDDEDAELYSEFTKELPTLGIRFASKTTLPSVDELAALEPTFFVDKLFPNFLDDLQALRNQATGQETLWSSLIASLNHENSERKRADFDAPVYKQILGWGTSLQENAAASCVSVHNGLDSSTREAVEESFRWTLLLQLNLPAFYDENDRRISFWGDSVLYFYIRDDELAARNFDAVWLIGQCD